MIVLLHLKITCNSLIIQAAADQPLNNVHRLFGRAKLHFGSSITSVVDFLRKTPPTESQILVLRLCPFSVGVISTILFSDGRPGVRQQYNHEGEILLTHVAFTTDSITRVALDLWHCGVTWRRHDE